MKKLKLNKNIIVLEVDENSDNFWLYLDSVNARTKTSHSAYLSTKIRENLEDNYKILGTLSSLKETDLEELVSSYHHYEPAFPLYRDYLADDNVLTSYLTAKESFISFLKLNNINVDKNILILIEK
jgi:hypothetical protein